MKKKKKKIGDKNKKMKKKKQNAFYLNYNYPLIQKNFPFLRKP